MKMTDIERKALSEILVVLGVPAPDVGPIVTGLDVDRREWSEDVSDKDMCVGRFVYFSPAEGLPVSSPPTHQGMGASHKDAPGGLDFLLFLASGVPQCLEIGSFGIPVPKALLDEPVINFQFQAERLRRSGHQG
ncbi:hypothetical protein L2Y96_02105 [Luteibacter aegosomaticola]|uniref:hypothetical protein n=1 Tax=Luteibacter aegosomaticola TaxID=2911538 RepID=UPI001FF99602|nr:hypothetical protein [Luteibacter aegosomaticola]UPG90587.1 hypothetical protein L2Y96_02105 [Luteibacter aegosomaticola]